MIKNKQRELISLLARSKNTFKTSTDLAIDLSLSDRTVRTYLKDLKEVIEDNGGQIISKQGHGFQLQIKDRSAFNSFLITHNLLDTNEKQSKSREASERKHYLLNLLLLESQKIDLDDLSECLFISTSQLNKDIAEIKNQLIPYELTLKKNRSIVFVEGLERAKRHFIMSYFFRQKSVNFLQQLTSSNKFCEAISFDMLTIIILDECREGNIRLSDVMIQNVVLHLALSIKRLQSGLSIQNISMPQATKTNVEYQIAKKIIDRIESIIGFSFPKEEQMYLTLHLMTKSNFMRHESDLDLCLPLTDLLFKIQQETGYLFAQDEQLKNGLIQHLKPMLIRLEQNIKLDNPLLDEIKLNYPELLALIKHYCGQLPNLMQFEINDDEWGYLALHFLASIEKLKNEQKAKVIIICATGLGSAQLLKTRVESEFDERIKIVAIKGYYETNTEMLNDVDFIISSIDLSSKVFKIPVFHVSVFLTEQDVQQIRRYLSCYKAPISNRKKPNVMYSNINAGSYLSDIEQIIDDLAADYFYLCQETVKGKAEILDHLLNLLAFDEAKNYKQEMKQQIENRMALGEIFFSQTIVVPHPAIAVSKLSKIGIAIMPNGLFWDQNYPSVHFIFMISPSIYQNPHLAIMTKAIVALIEDFDVQQKMLRIENFTEFKKLFMTLIEKGA
ncbi:BglG family transcription antiterminator [Orbus wheelerorum]|uniref:BglG family transcription antiterminator n=1 Tax=Orbus wheelerorum TaxID=3074111 RepID=UPI00370D7A37